MTEPPGRIVPEVPITAAFDALDTGAQSGFDISGSARIRASVVAHAALATPPSTGKEICAIPPNRSVAYGR